MKTNDDKAWLDNLDELAVQVQGQIITPHQFKKAIADRLREARIQTLEELETAINDVGVAEFNRYTWGDALGVIRTHLNTLKRKEQ